MDSAPRIISAPPRSLLDADGRPSFGAFRGTFPAVRWEPLRGPFSRGSLFRRLHAKSWLYTSLVNTQAVVAMAIIDVGIAASAFVYVFDRAARKLVADRSFTAWPKAASIAPQPTVGANARFTSGGTTLAIVNLDATGDRAERYRATAIDKELLIRAELVATSDTPPPLAAVAPIAGGVANCTHKSVRFEVHGEAEVAGQRFDLGGGSAAFDHTSGLLARDTRWNWASASGPGVALNLVEGFNGPIENVIWLGPELIAVGAVRFDVPKDPLQRWTMVSEDGRLELELVPEGLRRQDKNLVVAKSRYVQPFGTFRGVLREGSKAYDIGPVTGVSEEHHALW